jgi:hypothetical protein
MAAGRMRCGLEPRNTPTTRTVLPLLAQRGEGRGEELRRNDGDCEILFDPQQKHSLFSGPLK